MNILWANIRVRSPPSWNSVFGTTWRDSDFLADPDFGHGPAIQLSLDLLMGLKWLCNYETSAATKWSPNATYKTVGRSRYYQILVRLVTQEFLLPRSMSDRPRPCRHIGRVVIKIYIFFKMFLWQTTQNLCRPPSVPSGWSAGQPRIFC